ncbi:hypothetical protein GN956_G19614 [Arapaima gigas]
MASVSRRSKALCHRSYTHIGHICTQRASFRGAQSVRRSRNEEIQHSGLPSGTRAARPLHRPARASGEPHCPTHPTHLFTVRCNWTEDLCNPFFHSTHLMKFTKSP